MMIFHYKKSSTLYTWQSKAVSSKKKEVKVSSRGGLFITRANDPLNPRYFFKTRLPFSDGVGLFVDEKSTFSYALVLVRRIAVETRTQTDLIAYFFENQQIDTPST